MLGRGRVDAFDDPSVKHFGGSPDDGQLASKGSAEGISGNRRGLEGGDFLRTGTSGVGEVRGLEG